MVSNLTTKHSLACLPFQKLRDGTRTKSMRTHLSTMELKAKRLEKRPEEVHRFIPKMENINLCIKAAENRKKTKESRLSLR